MYVMKTIYLQTVKVMMKRNARADFQKDQKV